MTTLAPCLELIDVKPYASLWLYRAPAGGYVAVVFNENTDGFVAHRSNANGTWLGPRLVSGYGLGRGTVLERLEDRMEAGEL